MIHPTAIVHPGAQLAPGVEIGPCTVIDEHVTLGTGCVVGPHAHLTGHTTIGAGNRFHAGCVIGDAPQDLKYAGAPTRLCIGDHNVFREHVTIHRSNQLEEDTVIGSDNFFMAHSHVGHNCVVGSRVTLANGALIAGHVSLGDRAFISGNCLVHQFVRVGTLALMQGGAAISQDLPPYTIARGHNAISGLNVVGLRRAGFTADQRVLLRRVYHRLFITRQNRGEAVTAARQEFPEDIARVLIDFVADTRRGICAHRREEAEPG